MPHDVISVQFGALEIKQYGYFTVELCKRIFISQSLGVHKPPPPPDPEDDAPVLYGFRYKRGQRNN